LRGKRGWLDASLVHTCAAGGNKAVDGLAGSLGGFSD